MSGLISSPVPAPDPAGAQVVADGWFPAIGVAAIRDAVPLGGHVVTNARLVMAIEGGMLHAFRELADWRTARVLEGAAALADVTSDTINGQNRAVRLWTRIVYYFAAAELAGEHPDIAATDQGIDRAAERAVAGDEFRRLALAAVADLLSIGGPPVQRNRVELL